MKRTTVTGITNESFFHPVEIANELASKRLKAEQEILAQKADFVNVDCPACTSGRRTMAFDKNGFSFQSCLDCQSLYMSPRPTATMLQHYYHLSDYGMFLQSERYHAATKTFRVDQARKRADKLLILQEKDTLADSKFLLYAPKTDALETIISTMNAPTIVTIPAPWEEQEALHVVGSVQVVSAFDIFERVTDVRAEFQKLVQMLDTGGNMILSMRSGSGYDLLTLWQHADICPLEHMNLITVEGINVLFSQCEMEIHELSTPGQLDLQIVDRIRNSKVLKLDRFTEYFLDCRGTFAHGQFQQFLQTSLLSSHMLVVGVKK